MTNIKFPYGKTFLEANIPNERLDGILVSSLHSYVPEKSPSELVESAIENPTNSKKLSELAVGKNKVVIIASDHTRPVPSKVIIPPILREIRKGNPDADVTILISTGCHRSTTLSELVSKFGEDIVNNEKIVLNVAYQKIKSYYKKAIILLLYL